MKFAVVVLTVSMTLPATAGAVTFCTNKMDVRKGAIADWFYSDKDNCEAIEFSKSTKRWIGKYKQVVKQGDTCIYVNKARGSDSLTCEANIEYSDVAKMIKDKDLLQNRNLLNFLRRNPRHALSRHIPELNKYSAENVTHKSMSNHAEMNRPKIGKRGEPSKDRGDFSGDIEIPAHELDEANEYMEKTGVIGAINRESEAIYEENRRLHEELKRAMGEGDTLQ